MQDLKNEERRRAGSFLAEGLRRAANGVWSRRVLCESGTVSRGACLATR